MIIRYLKELPSTLRFHPVVFSFSAIAILLFLFLGSTFTEPTGILLTWLHEKIITTSGWFYILVVGLFFIYVIWLYFSKHGSVRLGKDDDEPEYIYWAWFSMLFSAGMGIGLLFFSVAEPIMHFALPPRGLEPESVEAARQAMAITFFHWGMHAWAIYIIIAISLAYFSFRHDLPLSLRSALYPLIGKHIHGFAGNLVDILAVFGTLFGLATSLGLGVMQVNSGLDYLGVLSVTTGNQILLIILITLGATISVAMGLDRGIRRLSEFNLAIAGLLLLFVLIFGPTVFLLSSFIQNIGLYVSNLMNMTFRTDVFLGIEWQMSWTMFYWAWWISWSPFVGMFIARISRGRTIREFIAGVMLVPTTLTFFFLTVFGNTALHIELFGQGDMIAVVSENLATAIFAMLDILPLSGISAVLTTIVITVFFITSSDSGSLVIDTITSGDHPDRPAKQRVFWALIGGAIAAVLLLSGGLTALQTAAITTALPFSVALLVAMWGFYRGLQSDHAKREALLTTMGASSSSGNSMSWRQRLRNVLSYPSLEDVRHFQNNVVLPAVHDFAEELRRNGCDVHEFDKREDFEGVGLEVYHGEELDFQYQVIAVPHPMPQSSIMTTALDDLEEDQKYYRAEVHLKEGGQNYDVMCWTREQLTNDMLEQYAKHLHFLHHMR